jgi:VWFA-related protein
MYVKYLFIGMRTLVCGILAVAMLPSASAGRGLSGSNPDRSADNSAVAGCSNETGTDIFAIPVRVTSRDLRIVVSLKQSDFTVTDDHLPQRVCGFAHARQPVSLGILLDTSGSMSYTFDGLAVAKAAINQVLDTSGPKDEYFLEHVNARPSMQCIFRSDLACLRAGLQAVPRGTTALIDALLVAVGAMRRAQHANRALLVISDGYENDSKYAISQLTRTVSAFPVPIFFVVVSDHWARWRRDFHSLEEASMQKRMIDFVNQSGGYSLDVSGVSKKKMLAAVAELAEAIRSPYILYLAKPKRSDASPFRHLRVEVKGQSRQHRVFYRGAYRVPSSSQ